MHRNEVVANPNAHARTLYQFLAAGTLASLLKQEPRNGSSGEPPQRRLSPADIDQLVQDYQTGISSTRALAAIYGVSRTTIAGHLRKRKLKLGYDSLDEAEIAKTRELRDQGMSLNVIG